MVNTKDGKISIGALGNQILNYMPGTLIPAVIALVSSAIFTRILDAADYGHYSVATSLIGLITPLASMWLEQSINRYLPGKTRADEINYLKGVVVVAVTLIIGAVAVVAALLLWVQIWFGRGTVFSDFWLPSILLVLVTIAISPTTAWLQASMQARRHTVFQLVYNFLRFLSALALVILVTKNSTGLLWGNFVVLTLLLPLQWRKVGLLPLRRSWSQWRTYVPGVKQFVVYGGPMIGWTMASAVLNMSDRWVIQHFRGPVEVGIYSANYVLISGAVGLATMPILLAAHPFLMRTWERNEYEETKYWLGKIVEWFSIGGFLITGGAIVFSRDLAQWFLGPSFQNGHFVMPVVLAGMVLWQMGQYLHKPLEFMGRTRAMLLFCLAGAVINIILNLVLVPLFGYAAAAYTTVLSYGVYAVAVGLYGYRIMPWQPGWRKMLFALCKCVAGTLLAVVTRRILEDQFGYIAGLSLACLVQVLTTWLVVVPYVLEWRGHRRSH